MRLFFFVVCLFLASCQHAVEKKVSRSFASTEFLLRDLSVFDGGLLQAADLGSKIVIELNPGEKSRPMHIGKIDRLGSLYCDVPNIENTLSAISMTRKSARGDFAEIQLPQNSGALVNRNTLVICRPENQPSRATNQIRIRTCVYASTGLFPASIRKREIFQTESDGKILGIAARDFQNRIDVQLDSYEGGSAAQKSLFNSCPKELSLPNREEQSLQLTAATLAATGIRGINMIGLLNDVVPREVFSVIQGIQKGEDINAAIPNEWMMQVYQ